jgi:hypothetical protein
MLLQEKWTPYDRISSLAVRLDIALDPPRFSVERVGFASGHYFGKKLGMREAVEIARQCRSQNDVIAPEPERRDRALVGERKHPRGSPTRPDDADPTTSRRTSGPSDGTIEELRAVFLAPAERKR